MHSTTHSLAHPGTLRNAVREVIEQNKSMGHNATRFSQATVNGQAHNLGEICERFICSPNAVAAIGNAIRERGGLLTIEDYVVRWGSEWGFDALVIHVAGESAEWFDRIVGYKRYVSKDEASLD